MNRKLAVACCVVMSVLMACGEGLDTNSTGRNALAEQQPVSGALVANPLDIQCGGNTTVRVTLVAGTTTTGRPVDIVLVLDRSGSMEGAMDSLKTATKAFVDRLDVSSDGVLNGVISGGSRVGVVSFASSATLDRPLTANATQAKAAIDRLVAEGSTNHAAGISTGQSQLASSPNARVMIIFTDGNTTAGGNPLDAAMAARSAGTEIFGIGLGSGINQNALRSWVSPPVDQHAFFTTDPSTLQQIFEAIGAAITSPAATNVLVTLDISENFSASGALASKGSVSATPGLISWSIPELMGETVTLTYVVTHDSLKPGGALALHASTSYSDAEGNAVQLANPIVRVHGCAAVLELTPKLGRHLVGQQHTVMARVLDDFRAPVSGVTVGLAVAGGSSIVDGEPSAPTPASGSGITDAEGAVPFTFTNSQASTDTITATAAVQPKVSRVLSDTAQHIWDPLSVSIDIKPHSDPSSYGAKSKGNIPVALIGTATFDVTRVQDGTVRFGDAPTTMGDAHARRGAVEDYNIDGIPDKVYHFYFPETNLDPSDVEGCLSGEWMGLDFMGCSDVNIVPR